MEYMLGLILLSNGGLDGNRQSEKNEEGETEDARAETIHRQTSRVWIPSIGPAMTAISDTHHILFVLQSQIVDALRPVAAADRFMESQAEEI
jgi:hypothetical protein